MQAPELRLQLDYPDDLKFIRELYKNLEPKYGPCFGVKEILSLLNKKPHLANINFDCKEKVLR